MKETLVANRIECLSCGSILHSKSVHDFVTCACGRVSLDGGSNYQRVLGEGWKDISVTTSDTFELQRSLFSWKTYGKMGTEAGKWVYLKDMDTEHIEAILGTQQHIRGTYVEGLLKKELEYRNSY